MQQSEGDIYLTGDLSEHKKILIVRRKRFLFSFVVTLIFIRTLNCVAKILLSRIYKVQSEFRAESIIMTHCLELKTIYKSSSANERLIMFLKGQPTG